jgi:transposase InsO family protein
MPITARNSHPGLFTGNVRDYELKLSLGPVGYCYDNAMIESF